MWKSPWTSSGAKVWRHIPFRDEVVNYFPGKGVIILLHGEPGVGKTSTAECIADYTSRPLYPITCGDIGETADDVESNLEKTFQLAHKWGCVLLLDEAE